MVICQGRLDGVVPLENASMPGRVVVQWDKDDCADMGIVKIDLLGLGMMAALQDALEGINRRRPPDARPLGLWNLPPDDPDVYRMLQAADTIGVFQVESRAQMATLPRLKPERFYDLVVEVALIRPGPIVGQMVHPYLNRRAGREPVALSAPVARADPRADARRPAVPGAAAADRDGGGRVHRRPGRGTAPRVRLQAVRAADEADRGASCAPGMARQGITGKAADEIVLSITSFALYGFPESHSASFALLVYASAYLKAHYPAAFYAALLNNQPMGFYHPATLVKDAQRHGVRFAPVDVQQSDWACTVEEDGAVRLGLRFVAGLRAQVGERIAGSGQRPAVGRPGCRTRARQPSREAVELQGCAASNVETAARSFPLHRGPRGAHRDQPGGVVGAGRDWRAQRVRPHAARGAVAGGAGHQAGGGAVRGRDDCPAKLESEGGRDEDATSGEDAVPFRRCRPSSASWRTTRGPG